jgi:hypothetical protein
MILPVALGPGFQRPPVSFVVLSITLSLTAFLPRISPWGDTQPLSPTIVPWSGPPPWASPLGWAVRADRLLNCALTNDSTFVELFDLLRIRPVLTLPTFVRVVSCPRTNP